MSDLLALVVEDEFDLSVIYEKAVAQAGFETEVIRSGDMALTWLSSAKPDLVVLDLNLPRVPGTEILHHIRNDPRLKKTRVVVITAYPDLAKNVRGEADQVLLKPITYGQLLEAAKRFCADASLDPQQGRAADSPAEQ
jgi:DNA-binding response OmpR family regulator